MTNHARFIARVELFDQETGERICTVHDYATRPLLIGIEDDDQKGDVIGLEQSMRDEGYDEWTERFFGCEFNILTAPSIEEGDQDWRKK